MLEEKNLNFETLFTPPELAAISREEFEKDVNGCGPSFFKNKTSFFERACEVHDIEYSPPYASDSKHRKIADKRFLNNMLQLVRELPWSKRYFRQLQAYSFFGFVRLFGWVFYNKK